MIEFNQVSKSFDGKLALDRVSLVLPEGETSVLLGTSGSGKSTILRLLAGLITPDSGHITVRGDQAEAVEPAAVQKIHGVDHQRDVRGVLAHGVGKVLVGDDGVLGEDRSP